MSISDLIDYVNTLCPITCQIANEGKGPEDQRHGGFMCVIDLSRDVDEPPDLVVRVGRPVGQGKAKKYVMLCVEKARRLRAWPNDLSSWQSRDPNRDRWGGAIIAGTCILSFSGLPELADEALMLSVAHGVSLISTKQAEFIAGLSNNTFLDSIMSRVAREGLARKPRGFLE